MSLILLPVVFALLWFVVWDRKVRIGLPAISKRGAFLLAYLLFETILFFMTEITSLGHHFTRGSVLTGWLVVTALLLVLSGPSLAERARRAWSHRADAPISAWTSKNLRTEPAAWLIIPFVYFGFFVYLAVAYLPSNGDSLDYHFARVEHWIQDRSVALYAAHFTAQVDYGPLAEYNLAHFHLLLGGDALDGFVQLFAAIVCVVAVSEITRLLGGSPLVQVGAVVVCTTIPSLVLSATSTENNVFAASLCACLIYVLVAEFSVRRWWLFGGCVGLAASLALLTKGTGVVLIGPAAAALLVWRVVTERGRPTFKLRSMGLIAGVVVVVALVTAGPFLYQNHKVFGSFEGPDAQAVLSTDLTWRAAGANIVRSTSSNFMFGNGRSGPETDVSKFVLGKFHRLYDVFGVPQDNWNYFVGPDTPMYFDAFAVRNFNVWDRGEDEGADPLDVLLIGFTIVASVVLIVRGDTRIRLLALIAGGFTVGYLVFAGISRWQIFQVRLFIPLFVAWSPLIAIALARCSRWLLRVTMALLAVACLPQLLDNSERPVLQNSYGANPLAPYFLDSTDFAYVKRTATGLETMSKVLAQSRCRQVGLGNFVVIEYPVWVGLQNDRWHGEIEDVGVQNPTAKYEDPRFHPCAIVTQPPNTAFVGTDPDRVQIGFAGQLGLSIVPADMRSVRTPIDGFTSRALGVTVFPGFGWTFGAHSQLGATGSLYIFSPTSQPLELRFTGAGGRAVPGLVVSSAAGVFPPTASNSSGVATIRVSTGMNQVLLASSGNTNTPPVREVLVGPPGATSTGVQPGSLPT